MRKCEVGWIETKMNIIIKKHLWIHPNLIQPCVYSGLFCVQTRTIMVWHVDVVQSHSAPPHFCTSTAPGLFPKPLPPNPPARSTPSATPQQPPPTLLDWVYFPPLSFCVHLSGGISCEMAQYTLASVCPEWMAPQASASKIDLTL